MECEVSPRLWSTQIARLLHNRRGIRLLNGRRSPSENLGFLRHSIGNMDVAEVCRN